MFDFSNNFKYRNINDNYVVNFFTAPWKCNIYVGPPRNTDGRAIVMLVFLAIVPALFFVCVRFIASERTIIFFSTPWQLIDSSSRFSVIKKVIITACAYLFIKIPLFYSPFLMGVALIPIVSWVARMSGDIFTYNGKSVDPDEYCEIYGHKYSPCQVEVYRQFLRENPFYVLEQYVKALSKRKKGITCSLSVKFKGESNPNHIGLKNEFLYELMHALFTKKDKSKRDLSTFTTTEFRAHTFFTQKSFFEAVGFVMGQVYANDDLILGNHFEKPLFDAICYLETLDFQRLEYSTTLDFLPAFREGAEALKLALRYAMDMDLEGERVQPYFRDMVELLKNPSEEDLYEEVQDIAEGSNHFLANYDGIDLDLLAGTKRYKKIILECITHSIIDDDLVSPIFQAMYIAKGMRGYFSQSKKFFKDSEMWKKIEKEGPAIMNAKVQGAVSKKELLNRMKINASTVTEDYRKKDNWKREWLEHEATGEEVQAFIKFVCGSDGMAPGKDIKCVPATRSFLHPMSYTCSYLLHESDSFIEDPSLLSESNHTKDLYIKRLKEAISCETY